MSVNIRGALPLRLDIDRASEKQRYSYEKECDSNSGHLTPPVFPPGSGTSGASLPPSLIGGKYLILEQSEGESLCRCVNVLTKEEYMCKVLPNDPTGWSVVTAHVRLDSHPNINPVQEVLVSDSHVYAVFPPCYGDLHSHLRKTRRLREVHARELFKQILEAVEACHSNGIVLRDLKLKKFVFANPERTVVRLESLCDCVVLDDMDDDDSLSERHGCPAYVSPEILTSGASYSGRRATSWGLGVILYTMLLGRYPFYDADPGAVLAKIRKGHYTIPDGVSSRARCLIRSLLRRDPSQRLSAVDSLKHPWLKSQQSYSFTNLPLHPRTSEHKGWSSRPDPRGPDQVVPESL